MNATLHQLKWDFRRVRTPWLLWILILIAVTWGSLHATTDSATRSGMAQWTSFGKTLTIYPLGILLIARLMFSTPFAGPNAFWKTRPITRRSLFWTKSILILLLIQVPVFLAQFATWQALNLGSSYLFWGSLHFGALSLAVFLFAAVWASLCQQFGSFALGLIGTGAFLAIFVVIFVQISARIPSLPIQPGGASSFDTVVIASTMISMVVILLVTALLAWILGALLRKRTAAIATMMTGSILAAGANTLWRTAFLNRAMASPLPQIEVEAVVLDQDDSLAPGMQALWSQLAIRLPAKQFARPSNWHAIVTSDENPAMSSSDSFRQSEVGFQQLRDFYPEETRFLNRPRSLESLLPHSGFSGKQTRLTGEATLSIYEWQRCASFPFQPGAGAAHNGGGVLRLGDIRQNSMEILQIEPPIPFQSGPRRGNRQSSRDQRSDLQVVLYNIESGLALAVPQGGYSGSGSGTLSPTRKTREFDLNAQRLRSLCGTSDYDSAIKMLRIDLYQPVPIATAEIKFEKSDWTVYFQREIQEPPLPSAARPTIAKLPLPANPTADQVDAYLDGVLFNIPRNPNREDRNRTEAELVAIGSEHLDRLLARMPVGEYASYTVMRSIRQLATDQHKPALLDALRRDPGLARTMLELGWGSDAAPILAERLRTRRPLGYAASFATLKIVAQQRDPATYDKLRWHFLRAESGIPELAELLADCPGFPFESTITALWNEVRLESNGRRQQVLGLAARLGDKEALREVFVKYATDEQDRDLQRLQQAVDCPAGESLPDWLHRNFEVLTYDPARKRFGLY